MSEVRDMLRRGVYSPSIPPDLERVWRTGRRRLWIARIVSIATVFALGAAGVVGTSKLMGIAEPIVPPEDRGSIAPATPVDRGEEVHNSLTPLPPATSTTEPTPTPAPSPSTVTTVTSLPEKPCTFRAAECMATGGIPRHLIDVDGTLWVGPVDGGNGWGMAPVDEGAMRLGDPVSLAGSPEDAVAWGNSLWVVLDPTKGDKLHLIEIDTSLGEMVGNPIALGSVVNISLPSVAVNEDFVFVTVDEGLVHRLDVRTRTLETFNLGQQFERYSKANGPLHLAGGEGILWVAYGFGEVIAFDPSSMMPTGVRADIGPNVNDIALGAGRLWLAGQRTPGQSVVQSLDEATGVVDEAIELPYGAVLESLDFTDGRLFVLVQRFDNQNSVVVEIDPLTRDIVGQPIEGPPTFQGTVALADSGLFIAEGSSGSLYRLDR